MTTSQRNERMSLGLAAFSAGAAVLALTCATFALPWLYLGKPAPVLLGLAAFACPVVLITGLSAAIVRYLCA